MLRLLRGLFANPEAERDPEAWATRYAAHKGLAALLWLLLVVFTGPDRAALVVACGYAAWEAAQWPGGRRMAWDGLLDWAAVTLTACALMWVWHQQGWAALASGLAAAAMIYAGIWRRSRHVEKR